MHTPLDQVWAKVAAQKTLLPSMYGKIDFDAIPERFTYDIEESFLQLNPRMRLARPTPEQIERMRAYTLLGDVVADAYAALIPRYGSRSLVEMLKRACEKGLDAVPDAPEELGAFLRDMEHKPPWIDMDLIREGARLERNGAANAAPWGIRGAFLATFLNKYAALPMALTGTLTHETAARRVNETATFFTVTTLPGALERWGEGFKAAAMVRLMHSMVRYNILCRSDRWDASIYGIPIPQVDQMPAGLLSIFFLALQARLSGRRAFNRGERALVEFNRYRCYLLGLPEDLLADTPEGILEIMTARNATLRDGFDDATCGALIRATMDAYLPPDRSLSYRMLDQIERRFSRVLFVQLFLSGNRATAAGMGIEVHPLDLLVFAVLWPLIQGRMMIYRAAMDLPLLREPLDKHLVRKIRRLLQRYGHAEFVTDAASYRPVGGATSRLAPSPVSS
ncbi:MAG: oxygenase MpaB family protein [Myxococcales bacterium]|nr:DUF2236 domain-containing protein [Polyangiaceae bacterium]MDW8250098.1 oxygenase MpaB family protein [Myxococcales bacterium]